MSHEPKSGLDKIMAQFVAESNRYSKEKGLAADAFTLSYNECIESGKPHPLGYCYAFDVEPEAIKFFDGVANNPSLCHVNGCNIPLLRLERINEFFGHKMHMVLVVLPFDKASELVATRLQAVAHSTAGRLVHTMNLPSLYDTDFNPDIGPKA